MGSGIDRVGVDGSLELTLEGPFEDEVDVSYSLNGKTILLTGASGGIGAEMARLLGVRAKTLD